jgi:hypothetical protein
MSDRARDYVKNLDNSRLRPPQKSFLFFLADYHNVRHSSAWPSLQTLAQDTGLSLRYIRRLVAECVGLRLISYDPGLGRGNKGRFRFLELDDTLQAKGEWNADQRAGRKGGQKGGQHDTLIRIEPKPEPEPRTKNHHARGATNVWLMVKEQLRGELPEDEWNLWVRPTYLLREMDHKFLLLAMPPNGAIMRAATQRKQILMDLLAPHGYSCGLTKYPDNWERSELEKMGWGLPLKRKPQVKVAI